MTLDLFPNKEALDCQYDEGYFGRVYRTALIVGAIAAALVRGRGGLPGLVGLTYGAAVSLGGLRVIEVVVRGLFRPGVRLNRKWVTALMVLKLPLVAMLLSGAAWLTVHHYANPFTLVGGLALAQAVIVLKAVGSLLVSALPAPAALGSGSWMSVGQRRAAAASARPRLSAARYRGPAEAGASGTPRSYAAARREPLPAPE